AKYLRLKVNDTLRVRLRTINGQQQSTAMTVVAIVKTNNMFLDMASYGLLQDVKTMMEYAPNESGSLQVILDDPKTAPEKADYLHQFLKPDLAVVEAVLGSTPITVVGFKRDTKAIEMVNAAIRIIDSQDSNLDKHSVLVSDSFATARNIRVGDILTLTYPLRFSSENTQIELTVTGLYEPRTGQIDDAVILVHEEVLFDFYYRQLPKISGPPPELKSLSDALSTEWTLLPRTHTSDEFEKKNQELGRQRLKNSVLDVRTMYETASKVLSLDMALRLITYIAVLVLFVIILIGIVNSQRMTIRERTREIGTMRSIGMQRRQVLGLFLLESLFLSVISSGIALIVSMLLMFLFSSITIQTETPLGIFLVGGHLVFKPTLGTLALNMLFIVSLTVIASYFPARRASRLEGAEALRHSEG
ncbi:ABC transporter permease, partial [bacterium]|nr:ABC transporter permease [bacterium]